MILPERQTRESDRRGLGGVQEMSPLFMTKNPGRIWKRRARARETASLAFRDGLTLVAMKTPRSRALSAVLIGASSRSASGKAGR